MATPITALDIEDLAQAIASAIDEAISPLERRLNAIESRKAEPALKWAGVFEFARRYEVGDITTSNGGLWLAVDSSAGEKPGRSSSWRLIVKSGDHRER